MSFERMHRWFSMRRPKGEPRKVYQPRRHSDGEDSAKLENGMPIIQLAESPSASRRAFPPIETSLPDVSTCNHVNGTVISSSPPTRQLCRPRNGSEDEKRAQEREVLEDHAAGYDLVRLDEVAAAAARLKVQERNGNAAVSFHREEYLMKHGHHFGGWKRRWVVLNPHMISIYKNVRCASAATVISMCQIKKVVYPCVMIGQTGVAFEIVIDKRSYILAGETESQALAWVELIRNAMLQCARTSESPNSSNGVPTAVEKSQTDGLSTEFQPYAESHASRHNSLVALPSCSPPPEKTGNKQPTAKVASKVPPTYAMPSRTCARHPSSQQPEESEMNPPELPPRHQDSTLSDDVLNEVMDSVHHDLTKADRNATHNNEQKTNDSPASLQLKSLLTSQ